MRVPCFVLLAHFLFAIIFFFPGLAPSVPIRFGRSKSYGTGALELAGDGDFPSCSLGNTRGKDYVKSKCAFFLSCMLND